MVFFCFFFEWTFFFYMFGKIWVLWTEMVCPYTGKIMTWLVFIIFFLQFFS